MRIQPHEVLACIRVRDWSDLVFLAGQLPGWVFRGQSHANWKLQTTLERVCGSTKALREAEQRVLYHFKEGVKRNFDLTRDYTFPIESNVIGWLAYIQHFGGMTRLLDFTRAIEVAAYFACADEKEYLTPTIWAINSVFLPLWFQRQLQNPNDLGLQYTNSIQGGFLFNGLFNATIKGYAVGVVEPELIFQSIRQQRQKGLFLTPLNLDYDFNENLYGMFDLDSKLIDQLHQLGSYNDPKAAFVLMKLQRTPVIKINIDSVGRGKILEELTLLGIVQSTLFPQSVEAPFLETLAKETRNII